MRKTKSWAATPYQWATVGFKGAVMSGKTTCGILFGATIYLGYLNGINATRAPGHRDRRRKKAIASVEDLFNGFIKRFGHTDCQTLTGCDWTRRMSNDTSKKKYTKTPAFINSNMLSKSASSEILHRIITYIFWYLQKSNGSVSIFSLVPIISINST